jgi:hypothetical protein
MFKITISRDKEEPKKLGAGVYDVWLTLPDQRRVVGQVWKALPRQWRATFYGPDGAARTLGAGKLDTLRRAITRIWNEEE